jgi:hypothetical protein
MSAGRSQCGVSWPTPSPTPEDRAKPREAARHFSIASGWQPGSDAVRDPSGDPWMEGLVAIRAGRYNVAIASFERLQSAHGAPKRIQKPALIALWLGQTEKAHALASQLDLSSVNRMFGSIYVQAAILSEACAARGASPLKAFASAAGTVHALAMGGGINRKRMAWEVVRRSGDIALASTEGEACIDTLRSGGPEQMNLPVSLLQLAEVQAGYQPDSGLTHAHEAAGGLRRRSVTLTYYLPDCLVRCAKLLETSDPAEAASLRHVARRWVLQALPYVPADARASFAAVPVNRQLLGEDFPAAAAGELRCRCPSAPLRPRARRRSARQARQPDTSCNAGRTDLSMPCND